MNNLFNNSLDEILITVERMLDNNEYMQARNTLMRLLEDEPDFAKAHNLLGWIYIFYFENEKLAEDHFKWAIKFNPGFKPPYLNLVELYLSNENYSALDQLMDRAMPVKGISKAFLFKHKAIAEEMKLNFSIAIHYYKKALFQCMDGYEIDEIKDHLKRCKMKRFKKIWSYGYKKNNR